MPDLTEDEILILFEFCHRFCETDKIAFSHHAEAVVLDKIAGQLERKLSQPFQEDYPDRLREARETCLEAYTQRMGGDNWIKDLPLEQV